MKPFIVAAAVMSLSVSSLVGPAMAQDSASGKPPAAANMPAEKVSPPMELHKGTTDTMHPSAVAPTPPSYIGKTPTTGSPGRGDSNSGTDSSAAAGSGGGSSK